MAKLGVPNQSLCVMLEDGFQFLGWKEHLRCFPINRVKTNDGDFHQHLAVIFYLRDLILGRKCISLLYTMEEQDFLVRNLEAIYIWLLSDCLPSLPRLFHNVITLMILALC